MLVLHAHVNAAASVAPTIRNHTDCTRGGGSSASCQGSEYSIISLKGTLKCNGRICIILTHCSLQTTTGHETQCKSCCDRNVPSRNQEFQCNSFIHFAILYIWLCNNRSNDSIHPYCLKITLFFSFKSAKYGPYNKLLEITLQACFHHYQMTAAMKGDGKSMTRVLEKH
jgi:hypothetical protein